MNRLILCFFSLLICISVATAQTPPKRELRAAWLSTFLNLDWPSAAVRTVQQVKDSVTKLIDMQQQTGINAIYFQVRSECDAMYAGSAEPWSSSITGTQGVAPADGFDPLQFMIAECRKRGIEIHAWFNPYRAVNNYNNIGSYAANHVARTHPEWLLAQGSLRILNPGIPAVRDYVISIVMDVLRRYDVDGIHYDDYFYPYPGAGGTNARFNDNATFAAYPRGFTDQNDWRRDNINLLIQRSYDSIKTVKPWVKFGVSPFGIWRNKKSDAAGSATTGLQSYSEIYADTKKWLEQGWVDYVTPQLYWSIGFTNADYAALIPWWNSVANGRHIYSGQAVYKINAELDNDARWNNPSQINNQVRLNRQYSNVLGTSFFRTRYFAINPLKFRDSLQEYLYSTPALLPTMPWRDNTPPQPVSNVTAQVNGNNVQLSWTKPPTTTNELDKARQFVVYRFNNAAVNLNDVEAIQYVTANDQTTTFTDSNLTSTVYYYVVTSLDRFHNESIASNVKEVSLLPVTIAGKPEPVVEKPKPVNDKPKPAVEKPQPEATTTEVDFAITANPNPTATFTIINYTLTKRSGVLLFVLDSEGREIMKLVDGYQSVGKQFVRFNTNNLLPGTYNVKIQIDNIEKTLKVVVNK
ncbi:putative secreted protein (Por secretion system target) [Lacibacter cauensis]|uniref:Putative secreted protein (Por secretion system target) n=1 Tax=Lacibacter cauensis TaxID=510947 RepID=A0A562SFZ0_9BACT|nr:family 10 glycosylhydrolase [Lacibacter cauensis]TWI80212.1 putative secreted protein (Por secretion system target) [Lacibacter cauensis]